MVQKPFYGNNIREEARMLALNEIAQQIKPRLPIEEFNRLLEAIDNDEEYNDLYSYLKGKKTIH